MKRLWNRILAFVLVLSMATSTLAGCSLTREGQSAVTQVELNHSKYVLETGKTLQLEADILVAEDAKTKLKWKSSNKRVAKVDSNGLVTIVGESGTATITVTVGKKTASCVITVGKPVQEIRATDLELTVGEYGQVEATVFPLDAVIQDLSFQSSNEEVIKVDEFGKVTALKKGSAEILITAEDCGEVIKVITVDVDFSQNRKPEEIEETEHVQEKPDQQQVSAEVQKKPTDTNKPGAIVPSETEGAPNTPDTPGTSDTPDTPNTPDTPDTPDVPGTPDTPATPDTPDTPEKAEYTITVYEGDQKLEDKAWPKNTPMRNIYPPYQDNKIFLGWYRDKALTDKVDGNEVLTRDMTLYASYGEANLLEMLNEGGSPNYISPKDDEGNYTEVGPDFEIIVDSHTTDASINTDVIKESLKLTNITSPDRTKEVEKDGTEEADADNNGGLFSALNVFREGRKNQNAGNDSLVGLEENNSAVIGKDILKVTPLEGTKYVVTAANGYVVGHTYQLEILDNPSVPDLTFDGHVKDVRYYNFCIAREEEVLNLSLNTNIKYIPKEALSAEDAEKIMEYTGLYKTKVDAGTGETTYEPTNGRGTFTLTCTEFDEEGNPKPYIAGDIIAVYEGTNPTERDLDSSLDEGVSYVEITKVELVETEGTLEYTYKYSYKATDAMKVLFVPNVIPIDVDNGDGTTGWTKDGTNFTIENAKLDFANLPNADKMGLDHTTVVEPGDYVAFFTGEFGADGAVQEGYGKITAVVVNADTTNITYEEVTFDEVLASMDIYNNAELSDAQLDAIDTQQIEVLVTNQVIESGFAEEAGEYLAALAVQTPEVREMLGESNLELKDCTITYANGTPVPEDELVLTAGPTDDKKKPNVKVIVGKDMTHFEDEKGFRVEVAIDYEFDIQKTGSDKKISVKLAAIFETEVTLGFNASGGAVWKYKWIFPYIYDYEMTGGITQGLYTGIAITAQAKLAEDDPEIYGPKNFVSTGLDDYAQQIVDLSTSIKKMMDESKNIRESDGSASGGLMEKYQRFIDDASDEWITLVENPIFSTEGSFDPFYVTAYGIYVDFVIKANLNVAIGMSFQYEKFQKHVFTLKLFHGGESSSNSIDLKEEYFQFDFYVMGTLGVRAGIRAKVLFGLFSVKLAGIGVQIEAGAYARLWGYFYYCMRWDKDGIDSSATGAMLIEIGSYINIALAMEVLNGTFSYNPTLFDMEWPLWGVGEQNNVLDFVYNDNGTWSENGKGYRVPLAFEMLRVKEIQVPAEIFRMSYMDLKTGKEGIYTYDSKKRGSVNPTSSAYDDEERFFVEVTKPFVYDPTTNTLSIIPEEGYGSYEGTMTITWKQPDIAYASKTLSKTFELSWIDPDAGWCLTFNTLGGSSVKSQILGTGKPIDKSEVVDPQKIGYEFGGWCMEKNGPVLTAIPDTMPGNDLTLYAKWIPIPNQYTVMQYYQNIYGDYVLKETTVQENKYTDVASNTTRVYTDDELDLDRLCADNWPQEKRHGFELNRNKSTRTIQVAPDGSTVVKLYYDRLIHQVTNKINTFPNEEVREEYAEMNPDMVTRYRYEQNIYAPEPFMFGYDFMGWTATENSDELVEIQKRMDVDDLTYYAKWAPNANTPFYVEYYSYMPDDKAYAMLGGENGRFYHEGETDSFINVNDYRLEKQLEDGEGQGYILKKVSVNGKDITIPEGQTIEDVIGTQRAKIDSYGKLIIRFFYESKPYNLTFNCNGGTLTSEVPNHYLRGLPLDISEVIPTRRGYQFVGWYEGDSVLPIDSIPVYRVGDITLEAVWSANKKDIELYAEDGATKLGSVAAAYGKQIPNLKEEQIPTKPGYDFAGFYTEAGELYYDRKGNGKVLWESDENVKLKAAWTPAEVEVYFDANGGNDGKEIPSVFGTYLSKYPTLPTIEKTGYDFAGWSLNGEKITEDTIMEKYDKHTLTAQWTPRTDTAYTVECYVPVSESDNADAENYQLFASYVKEGTTDTKVSIKKDEYRLPGFFFDETNTDSVMEGTIASDGSTVLKMYYREGNTYKVTFKDEIGGLFKDETDGISKTYYLKNGEEIPYPENPTAEHLIFRGWKADNIFYGYDTGYGYGVVHEDVEFTAVWDKSTFTIRYNNNLPNPDECFITSKGYAYDEIPIAAHNVFSRPWRWSMDEEKTYYYEFIGWNTRSDGSGSWYQPGEQVTEVPLESGILFAQWEEKELPEDVVPYYVDYNVYNQYGYVDSNVSTSIMMFGKPGEQTQAVPYDFGTTTMEPIVQKTIEEPQEVPDLGTEISYTTVEVKSHKKAYTMTWDYNGGVDNHGNASKTLSGNIGDNIGYMAPETVVPDGEISEYRTVIIPPEGYEFAGWDVYIPEYMPEYDITAKAQYKLKDTFPVTVNYYTENLDGTTTLAESKTIYGKIGESVTTELLDFEGFEVKTPADQNAITHTVTGNAEDDVCEYVYARKEYTLSWDAGEGTIAGEGYTQGTVKFGAAITPPTLEREGYTGEWIGLNATMPAGNVTYKPQWTPQMVAYSVLYRMEGEDGIFGNLVSERKEAYAGTVVSPSNEVPEAYKDQVAVGFEKPLLQKVKVAGDGSTIIYYDYTRIKSYIGFDFSGATVNEVTFKGSGRYAYGTKLQLPELKGLSKTGYELVGWYDMEDENQTIIEGRDIVVGDKDVIYKLKCVPISYSITYDCSLPEGYEDKNPEVTNPHNPITYKSGYDFNISPAIRQDMAFEKWIWNGEGEAPEGVEFMDNGLVHITPEAEGDLSFKAVWTPDLTWFVARMDAESDEIFKYAYPKIQNPTIGDMPHPVKEGYVFDGWQKMVPYPEGSKQTGFYGVRIPDETSLEDLSYNRDNITAKWLKVTDGDIYVEDTEAFLTALEANRSGIVYRGISITGPIYLPTWDEPIQDVYDMGIYINGNNNTITIDEMNAPLILENNGYITGVNLVVNVNNVSETLDGETYFGTITARNNGIIRNCKLMNSNISSDADYFGGLAGYNRGILANCTVENSKITWTRDWSGAAANVQDANAYVGGLTGYNAVHDVVYNDENGEVHAHVKGMISGGQVLSSSVLAEHADKQPEGQTVYLGGIVGMNQGDIVRDESEDNYRPLTIHNCEIGAPEIKEGVGEVGLMYVGGVAGMDTPWKGKDPTNEIPMAHIFGADMEDTNIRSYTIAGGIIGVCNYGFIEKNRLWNVNVHASKGKAALIAAVYQSGAAGGWSNIAGSCTVRTDTGNAHFLAAEVPTEGHGYIYTNDISIRVAVRDNNCKVMEGEQETIQQGLYIHKNFSNKVEILHYPDQDTEYFEWKWPN